MSKRPDYYMGMINNYMDDDSSRVLENTIYLVAGSPGFSCFQGVPELLMQATQHSLNSRDDLNALLSYGNPVGYQHYLDELATFLTAEYGTKVFSSQLMATGGSSWAMATIGRTFVGAGTPVFATNPTFNGSLNILKQEQGHNLIPVSSDDNGIITEALEQQLEKILRLVGTDHLTDSQPYWGMLYLVPVYDNPTGVSLPAERCRRVVELARRYNLLVVADDIYGLLHYTGEKHPPLRLITYDNRSDPDYRGNVLSLGSFSKWVCPGLRLGWIEGPEEVILKLSSVPSLAGGSVCHFASSIMASALKLGFAQDHLLKVRQIFARRLNAVLKTLGDRLPSTVTYVAPEGGYFIWLKLPEEVNTRDFCQFCESKVKVAAAPGEAYYVGEKNQNCIRITFGYYEEDVLVEAVTRMCSALAEFISEHKG